MPFPYSIVGFAMTDEDVAYVIETVRAIVRENRR